MFTHKNLMTVCCAAVLALGLAACGGGGGDDAPVPGMADTGADGADMEPMEPMEPTAAEQLANAQAAVADAQTMVDALPAAPPHLRTGQRPTPPWQRPSRPSPRHRGGIVKLIECRLFSAFLHEAKLLNLRGGAIDNVPRFRSESG